jgi:hypothetical protein
MDTDTHPRLQLHVETIVGDDVARKSRPIQSDARQSMK